jgi:hypothetical protein
MDNPMAPLYNGGIIQNSEFNNGLTGWSVPWGVHAVVRTSLSGHNFTMSRSNGAKTSRTVFQKIQMESNNHYALSGTVNQEFHLAWMYHIHACSTCNFFEWCSLYAAWFQVSNREAIVKSNIKAPNGDFIAAGAVVVKPGCWTMLKGGMTSNSSGPAELSFEV